MRARHLLRKGDVNIVCPQEILQHLNPCVIRNAINIQSRHRVCMRHMEGASLWGLVARVLPRVLPLSLERERDTSRSVRSFFVRFGLVVLLDIMDPPTCGERSSCLPHCKRSEPLSQSRLPVVTPVSLHPHDRCLVERRPQGPLCLWPLCSAPVFYHSFLCRQVVYRRKSVVRGRTCLRLACPCLHPCPQFSLMPWRSGAWVVKYS